MFSSKLFHILFAIGIASFANLQGHAGESASQEKNPSDASPSRSATEEYFAFRILLKNTLIKSSAGTENEAEIEKISNARLRQAVQAEIASRNKAVADAPSLPENPLGLFVFHHELLPLDKRSQILRFAMTKLLPQQLTAFRNAPALKLAFDFDQTTIIQPTSFAEDLAKRGGNRYKLGQQIFTDPRWQEKAQRLPMDRKTSPWAGRGIASPDPKPKSRATKRGSRTHKGF